MSWDSVGLTLTGGALIGVAVTIMLLFNGRVTGVSGIIGGALSVPKRDFAWRVSFVAGLIAGGAGFALLRPEALANVSDRPFALVMAAGFLVGIGTSLSGGCTSGHGVCGISRFSMRSIVATVTFMLFGCLAVVGARFALGGGL